MLISGYEFWALKATHGLSLDFIIEEFFEKGIYPKWDEVLLAAKADGANVDKLVRELKMHFENICTSQTREDMIIKITLLHERMKKDGKLDE